jgi:hypothetical protein
MEPADEVEGRRKQTRGQALRLARTQKSMPPLGAGGVVTTGAVSWSRGEPGYYSLYKRVFFFVEELYISKTIEAFDKKVVSTDKFHGSMSRVSSIKSAEFMVAECECERWTREGARNPN